MRGIDTRVRRRLAVAVLSAAAVTLVVPWPAWAAKARVRRPGSGIRGRPPAGDERDRPGPEGRRVFAELSVQNNLRLGAWVRRRDGRRTRRNLERVFELFPVLAERRGQLAGTLSGGEQQMLAIGRGMMADPRLLLIDEASLGLSPKLAAALFVTVRRIADEGVSVLLVEQNAGVLEVASRAFVMQKGRIQYEGPGSTLLARGELRTAYLGVPA